MVKANAIGNCKYSFEECLEKQGFKVVIDRNFKFVYAGEENLASLLNISSSGFFDAVIAVGTWLISNAIEEDRYTEILYLNTCITK